MSSPTSAPTSSLVFTLVSAPPGEQSCRVSIDLPDDFSGWTVRDIIPGSRYEPGLSQPRLAFHYTIVNPTGGPHSEYAMFKIENARIERRAPASSPPQSPSPPLVNVAKPASSQRSLLLAVAPPEPLEDQYSIATPGGPASLVAQPRTTPAVSPPVPPEPLGQYWPPSLVSQIAAQPFTTHQLHTPPAPRQLQPFTVPQPPRPTAPPVPYIDQSRLHPLAAPVLQPHLRSPPRSVSSALPRQPADVPPLGSLLREERSAANGSGGQKRTAPDTSRTPAPEPKRPRLEPQSLPIRFPTTIVPSQPPITAIEVDADVLHGGEEEEEQPERKRDDGGKVPSVHMYPSSDTLPAITTLTNCADVRWDKGPLSSLVFYAFKNGNGDEFWVPWMRLIPEDDDATELPELIKRFHQSNSSFRNVKEDVGRHLDQCKDAVKAYERSKLIWGELIASALPSQQVPRRKPRH